MSADDRTPEERLDPIFDHPELDDRWQGMYQEMIAQLRSEAAGLPMSTVQSLLIERIAYDYVYIRMREEEMHTGDSSSSFNRPNVHKEYNNFWLDMTKEFHKVLNSGQDKLRQALLLEIQSVVSKAVDTIPDNSIRKSVRLALAEGFAEIDAPGVSR